MKRQALREDISCVTLMAIRVTIVLDYFCSFVFCLFLQSAILFLRIEPEALI